MTTDMTSNLKQRQQELLTKRDELANRLQKINLDYRQGLEPDFAEQAQQLENAEVLAEIARVTAEELGTIDAALQRIEQAMRNTGE